MNNLKINTDKIIQQIINDNTNYINVNGAAGCGKTTVMIKKIENEVKNNINKNILILTLVSSVTNEIKKRTSETLQINIKKIGNSNHYLGEFNKNNISIVNFDAFIHCQLDRNNLLNDIDPIQFKYKKKIYNENSKNINNFYLKNKEEADIIIIDEYQDFNTDDITSLVNILKNNINCKLWIFGDKLQSIFLENSNNIIYASEIFNKNLNFNKYYLSNCYRCPLSHIKFVNFITNDWVKYYQLKPLETNKTEDKLKPYIFTHPPISKNEGSEHTAELIKIIVKNILDENINPGKITIIASKINDNHVFIYLEKKLKLLYNNKDLVIYFKTKEGDEQKTIDLNKIKETHCSNCKYKFTKDNDKCKKCNTKRENEKTSLISIHGIKGGENEVIILFGCSEKSIPKENHVGKEIELNDKSLFNVGITRSTKYLFIGVNHTKPSYYFREDLLNENILNNLYYLCANIKECLANKYINKYGELEEDEFNNIFKNFEQNKNLSLFKNPKKMEIVNQIIKYYNFNLNKPEIFKKIDNNIINYNNSIEKFYLHSTFPKFLKKVDIINTPDRNILTATLISENFESIKELNLDVNITSNNFGEICKNLKIDDNYELWGKLSELIIMKKINNINNKNNNFITYLELLNNNEKVEYIDNIRYLCIIKDYSTKCFINKNKFYEKYKNSSEISKLELDKIMKLFKIKEECIFLPKYFYKIIGDINIFLNNDYNKIDANIYFNIVCLYDFYNSSILTDYNDKLNSISKDISLEDLFKNIDILIPKLDIKKLENDCYPIECFINDVNILKKLNIKNSQGKNIKCYRCSIEGRIDAISKNNDLYEFKLSQNNQCKDSWIIQVLIYKILGLLIKDINENLLEDDNYLCYLSKKEYVNKCTVINFFTGIKYDIYFNNLDNLIKKEIINIILDKFNFIQELKEEILKVI